MRSWLKRGGHRITECVSSVLSTHRSMFDRSSSDSGNSGQESGYRKRMFGFRSRRRGKDPDSSDCRSYSISDSQQWTGVGDRFATETPYQDTTSERPPPSQRTNTSQSPYLPSGRPRVKWQRLAFDKHDPNSGADVCRTGSSPFSSVHLPSGRPNPRKREKVDHDELHFPPASASAHCSTSLQLHHPEPRRRAPFGIYGEFGSQVSDHSDIAAADNQTAGSETLWDRSSSFSSHERISSPGLSECHGNRRFSFDSTSEDESFSTTFESSRYRSGSPPQLSRPFSNWSLSSSAASSTWCSDTISQLENVGGWEKRRSDEISNSPYNSELLRLSAEYELGLFDPTANSSLVSSKPKL